jgi:hypothetical protein
LATYLASIGDDRQEALVSKPIEVAAIRRFWFRAGNAVPFGPLFCSRDRRWRVLAKVGRSKDICVRAARLVAAHHRGSEQEAVMPVKDYADNLSSAVSYALETTRSTTVCPFHLDVTIRVGDDAAESHAFARARKIIKSDGTTWKGEALREEFRRQLSEAADGQCPYCAARPMK